LPLPAATVWTEVDEPVVKEAALVEVVVPPPDPPPYPWAKVQGRTESRKTIEKCILRFGRN